MVLLLGLISGAAHAEDPPAWPQSLTVGTEAQGSAYDIYGRGVAELLTRALDIEVSPVPTGGSYQNAALMQTGDLDLGLVAVGPLYDAWSGNSPLSPTLPHDQLRAVFPMFRTAFQMVTLDGSAITSTDGLGGTVIGAGPAGGASGIYVPRFFETLGIEIQARNGEAEDLALQLRHGLISALALADGVPVRPFAEIEPDAPAPRLLSWSGEQQAALLDAFPSLVPVSIPAGSYPEQEADVQTVAMWHFMVARADLPEDLVYAIAKAALENQDALGGLLTGASDPLVENIVQNTVLPLHPGAVRYYEEIGVEIPEELKAW